MVLIPQLIRELVLAQFYEYQGQFRCFTLVQSQMIFVVECFADSKLWVNYWY